MIEAEMKMVDIHMASDEHVSIELVPNGARLALWVNVQGVCRLRIKNISPDMLDLEGLRRK